jgi:hypothetical protein
MAEIKTALIKPRYRPSVEREKQRYWAMKNTERRIAARHAKHPRDPSRKPIPDNSAPWLDHKPRSFAEIFFICDQIEEEMSKCG